MRELKNLWRKRLKISDVWSMAWAPTVRNQVAYLLASKKTILREFGVYNSIRDNFPKYVVIMDELDMSRDGIKHRNIRDFLLASEWN